MKRINPYLFIFIILVFAISLFSYHKFSSYYKREEHIKKLQMESDSLEVERIRLKQEHELQTKLLLLNER